MIKNNHRVESPDMKEVLVLETLRWILLVPLDLAGMATTDE